MAYASPAESRRCSRRLSFHGWVVRFAYYQDQAFALPRHRLTGSGRKTSHPGHLQAYTCPFASSASNPPCFLSGGRLSASSVPQDLALALPRHRLTGSGRKTSHPGHLQAYTRPFVSSASNPPCTQLCLSGSDVAIRRHRFAGSKQTPTARVILRLTPSPSCH